MVKVHSVSRPSKLELKKTLINKGELISTQNVQ